MEELQRQCNSILNDTNILEEDKIEEVEKLVDKLYGQKLNSSDKERLVLDILWNHREESTQTTPTTLQGSADDALWTSSPSASSGSNGNTISSPNTASVVRRKVKVVKTAAPMKWADKLANPPPSDPTKLIPTNKELNKGNKTRKSKNIYRGVTSAEWDEWNHEEDQTQDVKMSPFDILRQILGKENRDEDIMRALERNSYEIQATLQQLMESSSNSKSKTQGDGMGSGSRELLSPLSSKGQGRFDSPLLSVNSDSVGSYSPGPESAEADYDTTNDGAGYTFGSEKEIVMCKYFVQFGECLRSDCKFSHDLSHRICRFWLQGGCLAGDSCLFLHEIPTPLFDKLSLKNGSQEKELAPPAPPNLTEDEFPALGGPVTTGATKTPKATRTTTKSSPSPGPFKFKPGTEFRPSFIPGEIVNIEPQIKPRAQAIEIKAPQPTIPQPAAPILGKLNRCRVEIAKPQLVPWVAKEYGVNPQYVKHRLSAHKHGYMRNKYLQLAASSWHKNDAATAKLMSQKGQTHNDAMIEEYLAASDVLFEHRHEPSSEIYIDLHGMELNESIERLREVLSLIEKEEDERVENLKKKNSETFFSSEFTDIRPVYAICGSGRHTSRSRSGEDMLSLNVKEFLDKHGYEWKDFSSADPKFGKVIGIDPWSYFK